MEKKLFHSQLLLGRATDVEALMSWMWIWGWLFTKALLCNTVHTLLQKYITHVCLEPTSPRSSPQDRGENLHQL